MKKLNVRCRRANGETVAFYIYIDIPGAKVDLVLLRWLDTAEEISQQSLIDYINADQTYLARKTKR